MYTHMYLPPPQMPPPPTIPQGWRPQYSDEHKQWYFVNTLTGRSTWDIPSVSVEDDKFMFPIRNQYRSFRTPLSLTHHEKDLFRDDEMFREHMRSRISPYSMFGVNDPKMYVSGNFFVNIGIHFPINGNVLPHSKEFAYFKRTIKEQGIFCEKMNESEVLDIPAELFTYNPYMNIDPVKNTISSQEYRSTIESIRRRYASVMPPASIENLIANMDIPEGISVTVILWKMLLYAKTIQERCEGMCRIDREDPREQSKPGSLVISTKQKQITNTTCGFTAPSVAVATIFLQVMGSDFLDTFRKHSKCSVKASSSRSRAPHRYVKKIIYNDEMLTERLALFDKTLSIDEPRLYAKINTVVNQLYDNNHKYKTGINYMGLKRPDLFNYTKLHIGVNIISVVHLHSRITVHHSFIYNMGNVSVVMDSWAHGTEKGYIFGREMITRLWITSELEHYLNNLHPQRTRTHQGIKNTLIRVFLAPHMENIQYYPQFLPSPYPEDDQRRRLYINEMVKNDQLYSHDDYVIISINQNFLMTIFSFNFGFTNDILFGGGKQINRMYHCSHPSGRSHRSRNNAKTHKKNKK